MAANSKTAGGIANLGKRIVYLNWNWVPSPSTAPSACALSLRRAVHSSAYDKNLDEQIRPTVVPDHVIQPISENYWAPHPQTGVFGPPTQHTALATDSRDSDALPAASEEGSVLEQKAWFRHTGLEDLEKPHFL